MIFLRLKALEELQLPLVRTINKWKKRLIEIKEIAEQEDEPDLRYMQSSLHWASAVYASGRRRGALIQWVQLSTML